MDQTQGERRIVLWVPDWSIVSLAALVPPAAPAVTVRGALVAASTRAARAAGIRPKMRQSTAQYLCPELLVLSHDPVRDDSAFEVILRIFDQQVADVNALWPGLAWAALPAEARWRQSEEEIVSALAEQVAAQAGIEAYVGVGTGMATAVTAARQGRCVSPSETQDFLAPAPIARLLDFLSAEARQEYQSALDLLQMLGVRQVSQLRDLGAKQLLTRFGQVGERLWSLSQGGDLFIRQSGQRVSQVRAHVAFDPPVTDVAQALVGARRAAQDLVDQLEHKGLYAQALTVDLEGSEETVSRRRWTLFDTSSSPQVSQRIIWQIRGWQELVQRRENEPGGALQGITVIAEDVLSHFTTSPLWGAAPRSEKVGRAVAQVQLLVGEEAVTQPHLQGGLDPRSRVHHRLWGEAASGPPRDGEWAGAVKESPHVLFDEPPEVKLIGANSAGAWGPLWVDRRGALTGTPKRIVVLEERRELAEGGYSIADFVGLWAVKGQWWTAGSAQTGSRCYLRVRAENGADLLLVQREQRWQVEGLYHLAADIHQLGDGE